jgi:hypothetical protein
MLLGGKAETTKGGSPRLFRASLHHRGVESDGFEAGEKHQALEGTLHDFAEE